jgi:hypothetical protein
MLECDKGVKRCELAADTAIERYCVFEVESQGDHACFAGSPGNQARRVREIMSVVEKRASELVEQVVAGRDRKVIEHRRPPSWLRCTFAAALRTG